MLSLAAKPHASRSKLFGISSKHFMMLPQDDDVSQAPKTLVIDDSIPGAGKERSWVGSPCSLDTARRHGQKGLIGAYSSPFPGTNIAYVAPDYDKHYQNLDKDNSNHQQGYLHHHSYPHHHNRSEALNCGVSNRIKGGLALPETLRLRVSFIIKVMFHFVFVNALCLRLISFHRRCCSCVTCHEN